MKLAASCRAISIGAILLAAPLAACSPTTDGASHATAYAPSSGAAAGKIFAKQTPSVSTQCLDSDLKQVLADLKSQFGATPIVTSGHRPVGKRKGSYHPKCMAADVQIPGVSPRQVAAAAKKHPSIGGVGTYCHTRSVHIDTGPERSWHWSC